MERVQNWRVYLLIEEMFGVDDINQLRASTIKRMIDNVSLKLVRERNRGLSRHYRYDLGKHMALSEVKRLLSQKLRHMSEARQ